MMEFTMFATLFIITLAILSTTESYRILGIFPFQSRSHQMMFDGLAKGLSRRGHQIDMITVYPMKKPPANYTVVVNLEKYSESLVNKWDVKFASELGDDTLPIIAVPFGNGLCEYLGLPEVQEIIKKPPKNPPYDLVIVESFGSHCFIGFGHVLKVPVILASTTIDLPWLDEGIGQPANTAFFPEIFTDFTHPMSFINRVRNTLQGHINRYRYRSFTDDAQNALMKKHFGPDIPSLRELENNVVVALVNSWHTLHGVRPLTPAIIEVAGLHVFENYIELPKDLEKWMNESTGGVIYFTLGSMVNIETFPEETMRAFYSTFRRLAPARVLIKVANKDLLLAGLPENVITSSWIPQIAILSHKNTRAFITHGGLMSTQEALTFGIPMIGIPLFGDQYNNMANYKRKNMGLILNKQNLTEENIYEALNEILNNPKYKKAAEYHSARFLDRPLSAIDTAIYWIEYAIRNGPGALRSPIVDMPWWQVELLDVYGFLLVSFIIAIFLMFLMLKTCLKALLYGKAHKQLKRD